MSRSERTRAARIRAQATGQSYQQTLESPDGEPTSAQKELEGAFFQRLESLWYSPAPDEVFTSGIISVEPGRESLTVHLGRDTDLSQLRERLFPAIIDDPTAVELDDAEVVGVPGLRMRAHRAGTSLYRPGIAAEIVLARVRPGDLGHGTPDDAPGFLNTADPSAWTREEMLFVQKFPQTAGLDIESVVLRRLGIIRAAGAWSVHSWRSLGRIDVAVEVDIDDEVTPELAERVRDGLVSKHLTPQLVLDRYEAPREQAGATIVLSAPSTGQSVRLHLVRQSRPVHTAWADLAKSNDWPPQVTAWVHAQSHRSGE